MRSVPIACAALAVSTLALVASCAGPAVYARAEPINAYRAYGEYHPVTEDEAVVRKAATIDASTARVRLFQEALPEGIVLTQSTLGVAPGYRHRLLGKYAYSTGETISKDQLVLQVKKMCVATGANAAVILFQLVPNDHQDQAGAIEAVLVDLHEGGPARQSMTAAQCVEAGGEVVGDIGDGAIHRPDYRCARSGQPPLAPIGAEAGKPVAVEGAVCCGVAPVTPPAAR